MLVDKSGNPEVQICGRRMNDDLKFIEASQTSSQSKRYTVALHLLEKSWICNTTVEVRTPLEVSSVIFHHSITGQGIAPVQERDYASQE